MKVALLVLKFSIASHIIIYCICHHISAKAQTPKYEVRAVWLTTIGGLDWPHSYSRSAHSSKQQQREFCDILDRLKTANINTVLLQTRVRGTTIYPSAFEPWDGCLSGHPGVSPGYDALAFAVDECHKRGMELHAWIVTIPVGKWNHAGCDRLRKRHPGLIRKIGNEAYMNPEKEETAQYLAKICREITLNYDIDGIHLDYIRYPESWNTKTSKEQGRQNITRIVREIHNAVKPIKPWVKMSCSPIGKHSDLSRYSSKGWNAYDKVCQDAQGWLREGLMDALFPMMYFKGDQFYPFALDWKEHSYGRIIAAGLGVYFLSPKEQDWSLDVVKRKVSVLRNHGMGHAYFRNQFIMDNTKGIYDFLAEELYTAPALIPPMTWQSDIQPAAPEHLDITYTHNHVTLSWNGAKDRSGGSYLMYNIYASKEYPVNTNVAENLIATRITDQCLTIKRDINSLPLNYAVTALDRYGNESMPTYCKLWQEHEKPAFLLKNDGHTLNVPEKGYSSDANFITIESLQGDIIAIKPYTGETADISDLPEGFYILKSLGKKGISHRIGIFAK